MTIIEDFGFSVAKQTDNEVYYRGYGADNYAYYAMKGEKKFLGGAFEVASMSDLKKSVLKKWHKGQTS